MDSESSESSDFSNITAEYIVPINEVLDCVSGYATLPIIPYKSNKEKNKEEVLDESTKLVGSIVFDKENVNVSEIKIIESDSYDKKLKELAKETSKKPRIHNGIVESDEILHKVTLSVPKIDWSKYIGKLDLVERKDWFINLIIEFYKLKNTYTDLPFGAVYNSLSELFYATYGKDDLLKNEIKEKTKEADEEVLRETLKMIINENEPSKGLGSFLKRLGITIK